MSCPDRSAVLTRHITLALLCAAGAASSAHAQWTATNLNPAGAPDSYAFGTYGGVQVGQADVPATHAGLWNGTSASWTDLNPPGLPNSYARAVSGTQQAGFAIVAGKYHASLWSGTAASWIDLNPTGSSSSIANGVSGGRQIGSASFAGIYHAALWSGTAASFVDLHPAAASWSSGYGVNGNTQVGYVTIGGENHASLWNGSAASWVDLNPQGSTDSIAISASGGQQAGRARLGGFDHAGLWTGSASSFVDLQPAGCINSWLSSTCGNQQVGSANVAGQDHAGIWTGSAASFVDLHVFLPPGFNTSYAQSIWVDANYTYVSGYAFKSSDGRPVAMLWKRNTPTPSNDNCGAALPIVSGATVSGTTIAASLDGSDSCRPAGEGPDVWYSFTPTCTGTVTIDTLGSNFDTVLSAHSGCPGTAGNQVACNDDTAGLRDSSISFPVVAFNNYRIRVSGYGGASGAFVLHTELDKPIVDDCNSAFPVLSGTYSFGTCGATTDGPAESLSAGPANYPQIDNDIWLKWTADCSGNATVSTCGSTFDTKLAIYAGGCPQSPNTAIAANDDSCAAQASVTFHAAQGHQYLIRIGGYNGAAGNGTLTIGCTPANCPADFDSDGTVDFFDYDAFVTCFEGGPCPPGKTADFDSDGSVDFFDYDAFVIAFETPC